MFVCPVKSEPDIALIHLYRIHLQAVVTIVLASEYIGIPETELGLVHS